MSNAKSHSDTLTTPSDTYTNTALIGPNTSQHAFIAWYIRYSFNDYNTGLSQNTHYALSDNQMPIQHASLTASLHRF